MRQIAFLAAGAAIAAFAWFLTFGSPGDPAITATRSGGAPGGGRFPGAERPTMVTLATVEHAAYTDLFRSVGTGKALASVFVAPEVSGRVTEVHFGPNQSVEAGDALITLDDAAERISLRSARATLAEAEDTVSRFRTLAEGNSSAVSEVALSEAETQVELASAALARAEYDLEQRTIRAPIAGVLGLSDVETGDYLQPAQEIVTVSDLSRITIEFGLTDRAAGLLTAGDRVQLLTGSLPGQSFEGRVTAYDREVDSETRSILVRADADNSDGRLLPGMIFNVVLEHENPPLPRVPSSAITWSRNGASVWAVGEDGTVQPVPVGLRKRAGEATWLDSGLAEGTQIVAGGVQKMRPGTKVVTAEQAADGDAQKAAGE